MTEFAVTAHRTPDGTWILRGTCPHCHRTHTHGGGVGATPNYGHRSPHCPDRASERRTADAEPGYVLVPVNDERPT